MSRWSPVYVPEIETGRHVKNNVCTVEIKIKWMIRKHMTYENTYRIDINESLCLLLASVLRSHLLLNLIHHNFYFFIVLFVYD